MSDQTPTDWDRMSYFITAEIKRLGVQISELDDKISKIADEGLGGVKLEIAMLKVKSGTWGLLGGAIPIAIYFFVEVMKEQN